MERRQHPRFPLAQAVELSYDHDLLEERFFSAWAENLSLGGLLLLTTDPPEPLNRVYLMLPLGPGGPMLKVEGVVLRVEPAAEPGHFQAGVRFSRLAAGDKLKLEQYLMDLA